MSHQGFQSTRVAEAVKAIRQARRLRSSEVARAMGLTLRSYERFEAGTGPITYERLTAFADATNSDPIALLATIPLDSAEFAVRCADNKLMTVMMIAMMSLNDELADDIVYLRGNTLVGAFTRVAKDLVQHVRARETFAETWIEAGSARLAPTNPRASRRDAKT